VPRRRRSTAAHKHSWLGNEYAIDHVEGAIAGRNIRLPYFRLSGVQLDRKFLTIYRLSIIGDHIGYHDLARDDMVGKSGYQTLPIFRLEQILDGAFWQLGESFIGGCEDHERTFSVQSSTNPAAFMAVTSVLNCPALEATATMVSLRVNAEERGSAAESHRGMMPNELFSS
jgi:hypothetical protein